MTTDTMPAFTSVRHEAALISPIRRLSDGRAVIEADYALASTFAHDETEAYRSKTFDRFVRQRDDARRASIPAADRAKAENLARGLTDDFTAMRRRWKSGCTSGRLDGRAFVRVVEDCRAGRYSNERTRPFRRRIETERQDPPHIAVVADYAWDLRCGDDGYERRVGRLASAVLFAAEAADLPCTFAAVRGDWFAKLPGAEKTSSIAVLARPGRPLTAAAYSVATGQNGQDPFILAHMYAGILPNDWEHDPSGATVSGSRSGAGGIRWAREVENATFVIAIGNFPDDELAEADVHLPQRASPEEAVRLIRERLAIRNAA